MQEFTWIEILPETTPAADGTVTIDMGTRPKAGIALRVACQNATTFATLSDILGAIEDIRVELHGSSFIQLSGADLAAINAFLLHRGMIQENVIADDDATRSLVLYIPFGLGLCDPDRGLWETGPDEAKLEIDVDIADTNYDGLILEAAALEIPGAPYAECLRFNTITHTPSAVGNSDVDLPRVHPTIGYLVFSTTVHTGTAWTATADMVTLLEERDPEKFLENHWELWHGLSDFWLKDFDAYNAKIHAYTSSPTDAEQPVDTFYENYIWLPMCPDGNYADPYDPSRFSDLKMRFSAGVQDEAIRIIPVEFQTARR